VTAYPMHTSSRRRFVQGLALAGVGGALAASAAEATSMGTAGATAGQPIELAGDRFDLVIGESGVNVTGRPRIATTVNGSLPGPTLRFREGDTVTLNVTNHLSAPTSVHWHGLRLPAEMDGVPGLTFRGIMPGETFVYRFPILQTGSYWYHSHSGCRSRPASTAR
jgi:FtsP/CotA-like multicopper oxidase with cupredoxin domain